jgi:hypothetical protein
MPFAVRAIRKDPMVGLASPVLLAAQARVAGGLIYARRKPIEQTANSKAHS